MDSFADVWKEVLTLCKQQVTDVIFNIWIAALEPVKLENDTAVLLVNSDFKKSIVMDKFYELLVSSFTAVLGFPVTVDVIVGQSIPEKQPVSEEGVQEEFSFDNFVVGSSNKFAYAASIRVATIPGVEFNPLLIYGRSGLGKTHLMLAIYSEMKQRNPNAAIIYTTGENFTNELISCLAVKNTAVFHAKYRNVDALLVDDIQFIQKKVSTQEEFFHTFNTLTQAGKQIVLTSDRPPREMEILDERLRTRFEMGLLADIQPPDIDTRMAIVKRKGQQLGLTLSDQVVEYIAGKLKNNIRQLEGVVKKLSAMHTLRDVAPTIETAQEVIRDIVMDNKPVSVTVDNIIAAVSRAYGVNVSDMVSDKRTANIALSRQIAMYVIREITGLPLQNIGEYFGGKNHATVYHSVKQIENKISEDTQFRFNVQDIIKNIQEA